MKWGKYRTSKLMTAELASGPPGLVLRLPGEGGNVLVELLALRGGAGAAHGHARGEDRVRAELRLAPAPLVLAAVQLLHLARKELDSHVQICPTSFQRSASSIMNPYEPMTF